MFYPVILYNSWEQFPQKKLNIFTIKLKLTVDKCFKLCYNVFTVGVGF